MVNLDPSAIHATGVKATGVKVADVTISVFFMLLPATFVGPDTRFQNLLSF
jgi:hypothetical protein